MTYHEAVQRAKEKVFCFNAIAEQRCKRDDGVKEVWAYELIDLIEEAIDPQAQRAAAVYAIERLGLPSQVAAIMRKYFGVYMAIE